MDKIQHRIRLLELNAADWLFLFSGVGVHRNLRALIRGTEAL